MLPDQQPRPTRPYPVDPATPPPESRAECVIVSYALTLFLLGALVGLLALLGRIAQEAQHRVLTLTTTHSFLSGRTFGNGDSTLPPMIRDLTDPAALLIAFGFAICLMGIMSGAGLWRARGKPAIPRERRWTITAIWIALWLVIGMGGALFVAGSGARIAVVGVSFVLALAGFVALVVMVVAHTLRMPP